MLKNCESNKVSVSQIETNITRGPDTKAAKSMLAVLDPEVLMAQLAKESHKQNFRTKKMLNTQRALYDYLLDFS